MKGNFGKETRLGSIVIDPLLQQKLTRDSSEHRSAVLINDFCDLETHVKDRHISRTFAAVTQDKTQAVIRSRSRKLKTDP